LRQNVTGLRKQPGSGGNHLAGGRANICHEGKVGLAVLSAAANGERDPNKLRNAALLEEMDV
jgi:hypothetical protein